MTKRYQAIIVRARKCQDCDDMDAGEFNRIDCGCAYEQIAGESDSLAAARMLAGRMAKSPRPDGRHERDPESPPTGTWWVIDTQREEEIVAHS